MSTVEEQLSEVAMSEQSPSITKWSKLSIILVCHLVIILITYVNVVIRRLCR